MTFDAHAFWRNPAGSSYPGPWVKHCVPEFYLDLDNITRLIVSTIARYAAPEMTILELGCGTGRNLAGLWQAGFRNVAGVEINADAVRLGRATFPELANIPITIAPVEDVIPTLSPVDVIYTQGFLMHLPHEKDWVISSLRKLARRVIVTNEGERAESFHAWMHDFKALICAGGEWEQVETHSDEDYPPLPATTIKRVFIRTE